MAATALQTVWLHLVDAFAAISQENGYRLDVKTVTTDPTVLEALPSPNTPACVVSYDESVSGAESQVMPDQDMYRMVFRTVWRVDAPGLDTTARVAAYADLRDDVRRAIDVGRTCGGVAWEARLTSGSGPEMEGGRIFARWDVSVWAKVDDGAS
jgi:hypothetical protein